jgi:circadian clock protein KaiB
MSEDSARTWKLKLYIAGQTPRSRAALANLKRIVEEQRRSG